MNEVVEFFKGLFATNLWPARWHCGSWSDFHGWLYIISDIMVWLAYFLIPIMIINYFTKKRTHLKFQKIYLLFAAFILLCGTTHFLDALMFWTPMYRFNALVKFATGVISLITVFHLIKILPTAFTQKSTLELENEIARRVEAERKLSEANKGLQAFAYVASHDLQEPLRKIRTFSSLLTDANQDKFDERSKGFAEKIVSSSKKMQLLIQDVLTLSSIDHDSVLEPVDMKKVISGVIEDLEMKIEERKGEILVGDIPSVKGNEGYLNQLFVNLLSNSLKFSVEKPIIHLSGVKQGGKVIIQLKDNGIGMLPEDTAKIFDAFKRLNSKHQYEGTGIGLAICKKIIEIHNGKISVNSKPGQGTTFIIELPAA